MSKTQRWEWAIGLKIDELDDKHLFAAYKLNWDNLCKFDSCRKNCKRILCLACFDKSWIDNDSANSSGYDSYETTNCEQKRSDLKTFVGLKNLGATCYVNCLLQLWFHNPALRKAIYQWDKTSNHNKQQDDVNGSQKMILDKSHETPTPKTPSKRSRDEDVESPSTPSRKMYKTSGEKNTISNSSSSNDNQCKQVATINDLKSVTLTPPTISPQQKNKNPKDTVQTDPIEQLQLIFARLQFTNKKSIDPFNFIDSLALNAAEQQDAQEFGNLFMEFLERSLANQDNSFVSKIIQSQYCGKYTYVTTCDQCKHSSLSDSNFYELDLSIQNLDTLHDCLDGFFKPVLLDGKYNCSHCQKAQSAHRRIMLKSLPPTLNLQLLRFVYDVQRGIRQKLNSYLTFPEILDMNLYLKDSNARGSKLESPMRNNNYLASNGASSRSPADGSNIYILSAVLIHRGSSPHQGHYIAHIKDRVTKDWYKFNDDSVERIGPQLQVSSDGENITIVEDKTETIRVLDHQSGRIKKLESKSLKSKTAYMLVYQAQDNEAFSYPSDNSEDWILPEHLQTTVAEENSRSDEIFESLQIAKEVDQQILDARKYQIKCIYDKLICRSPTDKFEFIDKAWLQRWLTNSSTTAKFMPIDNSGFLCIHNKLDFRKLDSVKCVRTEGADMLYKEFGGGPRLQDAMCRDCVKLELELIQFKERLKEDQKFITSQAKFKLEAGYDYADAYLVGRKSYKDWQLLVMAQFNKSHPELKSRHRDNNSSGNQQSSDEDEAKNEKNSKDVQDLNKNDSESESDDEALEKYVFNSDMICEHQGLVNDTNAWRIVPKEVWMIFKRYFGNDPSKPLIERNANTWQCSDCALRMREQQEIGDLQKAKAFEQKTRMPDLFHNRKRASWCSMLPGEVYYALERPFLTKWQKFIRNPCTQEPPVAVKNQDKLLCEHLKSLYNYSNSNPVLTECPFVLITKDELDNLKDFYPVDTDIKFSIDPISAERKRLLFLATRQKNSPLKKSNNLDTSIVKQNIEHPPLDDEFKINSNNCVINKSNSSSLSDPYSKGNQSDEILADSELDPSEIDWSECVVSEPDYCSECHEMLKQDELKKLLNYESATIYITKVESPSITYGPHNNPNLTNSASSIATTNTNGGNLNLYDNCDNNEADTGSVGSGSRLQNENQNLDSVQNALTSGGDNDVCIIDEQHPFKRRKKIYLEDEANDFVPPGVAKITTPTTQSSNSILRRTTRRNRNREQAYTIKPTQTLLDLKKEIFGRCQVPPFDQRLFLNGILLGDNDKTMSQLRIVPNCSLRLEVDRPVSDNIDSIEDEPASRKSCAQPETGFKGSLLLSNSHL